MANTVSARKRARQNERRRLANNSARSQFRTYVKRVLLAIHKGDKEGATDAFRTAVPVIDRMAHKGIIHRNKAARHKSRLNARIRAMA